MTGLMRSSDCYDGIVEGSVDGGIERIWYDGEVIQSTILHGHLPTILTT